MAHSFSARRVLIFKREQNASCHILCRRETTSGRKNGKWQAPTKRSRTLKPQKYLKPTTRCPCGYYIGLECHQNEDLCNNTSTAAKSIALSHLEERFDSSFSKVRSDNAKRTLKISPTIAGRDGLKEQLFDKVGNMMTYPNQVVSLALPSEQIKCERVKCQCVSGTRVKYRQTEIRKGKMNLRWLTHTSTMHVVP